MLFATLTVVPERAFRKLSFTNFSSASVTNKYLSSTEQKGYVEELIDKARGRSGWLENGIDLFQSRLIKIYRRSTPLSIATL